MLRDKPAKLLVLRTGRFRAANESGVTLSNMQFMMFCLLLLAVTPARSTPATSSTFETDVRPILEKHCQPCHFPGGKMYGHLPFDRPSTVLTLGEKMFTRIKDEHERAVIRKFLAEEKK